MNSLWVEKYRPSTLDEYIANDSVKEKIKHYLEIGDIPHLLFYGRAGTGKTSLAKIIYKNIDCDYIYVNASDERGIDFIRDKVIPFASGIGFRDLKIVVLDEADALTPQSQAALRNVMETYSKSTRFILTCNYAEKIIEPIQSRCQVFSITPPDTLQISEKLMKILVDENIEYSTDDIANIVKSGYPDIRRIIGYAQRNVLDGKIRLDSTSILENNYIDKVIHMLGHESKKHAFENIRQLLADTNVRDYAELYSALYKNIEEYAKGHIAAVILILAEHQHMDANVVDKEINVMAMIIKLLQEIK